MTGQELSTFITGLNGGVTIDPTLLDVLVNSAQAIIEEERPWMVLRKTDTSKTVTTASLYTTAIDISTITDFSRFYGEIPVRLFDGDNLIQYYRQVPWDRRLEYKDVSNTFCFDENAKKIYLNGTVPFNGTLYVNFISTSTLIDIASGSAVWELFPSRFLPLIGFYAIGIHQGAVDYDTITARQAPANFGVMTALKNAMVKWDDERQLSAIESNDPTDLYSYPRAGAINRYE